ncbi:group III truncated hemoglobin [Streptomyces sp. NPDC051561]|uniref:group III truncated hemoglobin n=1 Tax=Streptomyces sp. NPDC051561 TaxID=3365658 RepID=UPI003797EEC9
MTAPGGFPGPPHTPNAPDAPGEREHRASGINYPACDLESRADIDALLRRFYAIAFEDPLIGRYFTEIAGVDLETHLPRVTDFWESALLRSAEYRRNALTPHKQLHRISPLGAEHFGRWLQLWRAAIDGMYAGPNAERAKAQGERVAKTMPKRLNGGEAPTDGEGPGFVPLSALQLRGRIHSAG